jgi:hypothetical protein
MRISTTIAVDKLGKSKMLSGPEIDPVLQRANFNTATIPDGGKLILWVQGSVAPKIRKSK